MTDIPTSIPTSIPTMIPTMITTPVFNDDIELNSNNNDDEIKVSRTVSIVIASLLGVCIMYITYNTFKQRATKIIKRWYKRQSENDNLARIMPA